MFKMYPIVEMAYNFSKLFTFKLPNPKEKSEKIETCQWLVAYCCFLYFLLKVGAILTNSFKRFIL